MFVWVFITFVAVFIPFNIYKGKLSIKKIDNIAKQGNISKQATWLIIIMISLVPFFILSPTFVRIVYASVAILSIIAFLFRKKR